MVEVTFEELATILRDERGQGPGPGSPVAFRSAGISLNKELRYSSRAFAIFSGLSSGPLLALSSRSW